MVVECRVQKSPFSDHSLSSSTLQLFSVSVRSSEGENPRCIVPSIRLGLHGIVHAKSMVPFTLSSPSASLPWYTGQSLTGDLVTWFHGMFAVGHKERTANKPRDFVAGNWAMPEMGFDLG